MVLYIKYEEGEGDIVSNNRGYVDAAAGIVKTALELNIPITLESLCEKIQEELPGTCIPKAMGELDVDAQITTLNNNTFKLEYLENKPNTRILFSIAHELGHLFLHLLEKGGKLKAGVICQRDLTRSQEEWEANEFAAALLMPEEDFIFKCKECLNDNKVNVTEVADFFNVSVQAATVRGNVLDLW